MTTNAVVVRFASNNYHEKLFEKFLLDEFLDVVLWAEGKSVSAHRCVLAAGSTVFHEMLKVCNHYNKMPVLMLHGIKFDHLRRIVEYLYCGKTKIGAFELDEFFLTAKRFKILGLHEPPIEEPNTSRTPHELSVSGLNCTLTYELPSDDDDDDNDDDDGYEHNQTREPEHHGTKRKIDENQNESTLQLSNSSRKSMPNVSKRTCTLPNQPVNGNGSNEMAVNLPDNRSTKVEKTATPKTTQSADPNEVAKHAMPSTSKSANGKSGNDEGALDVSDRSANNTNGQYKCRAVGCGRVFHTPQKLVRHRKFKCVQSKIFKCQRCHQAFAFRFGLIKHTCSGERANHS